MPIWICKDCDYQCRDKYTMERHANRKYPCNSVNIISRQKLKVIKQDDVKEEDITPEKLKVEFNLKPNSVKPNSVKIEKE